MVMHDVQNESLVFLYQLGTLSPLPSGEKEVSQTPHYHKTKNGVVATAESDKGNKRSSPEQEFSFSVESGTSPGNSVSWNALMLGIFSLFLV